MSSLQEPVNRPSARVLLLDGAGRILLFRAVELDEETQRPFWFAPGGGVEAGESYQAAARRELDEETGLDAPIGRCVWRRTHTWYFARRDVWYRSCERYFVARTDVTDLVRDGWSALEQAAIAETRWWTLAELERSRDIFVPRRLAVLLPPIVAGDLPAEPIDVGT